MTRTRWIYVAAAIGAALLLSAGQGFADKGGNRPGGGGGGGEDPPTSADPELVFVELGGNGASLVVADANGGNRRVVLSSGVDRNALPTWSPDGAQIAFRGTADGEGLYVVNVDGTGLTKIVDGRVGFDRAPWSPVPAADGEYKLAFHDTGAGGTFDVWVVNADGSGLQNVTNTDDLGERAPTWSPDATQLAVRFADGTYSGIMIVDVDEAATEGVEKGATRRAIEVTSGSNSFWELDWARQHDWIAYQEYHATDDTSDLYVLDLTSTGSPVNVTNTTDSAETRPSWAPDDSGLLHWYGRTKGKPGLHVLTLDESLNNTGSTSLGLDKGSQPDWRR